MTLLTKTEYLPGALVVHKGLVDVGSKYPLVVMVTSPVPQETRRILQERGMILVDVESLLPRAGAHSVAAHDIRFQDTWTKLRCVLQIMLQKPYLRGPQDLRADPIRRMWRASPPRFCRLNVTHPKRTVMLDSDMIVMRNMDELFDMELPDGWIAAAHACACNPRKLPHYPADW